MFTDAALQINGGFGGPVDQELLSVALRTHATDACAQLAGDTQLADGPVNRAPD